MLEGSVEADGTQGDGGEEDEDAVDGEGAEEDGDAHFWDRHAHPRKEVRLDDGEPDKEHHGHEDVVGEADGDEGDDGFCRLTRNVGQWRVVPVLVDAVHEDRGEENDENVDPRVEVALRCLEDDEVERAAMGAFDGFHQAGGVDDLARPVEIGVE